MSSAILSVDFEFEIPGRGRATARGQLNAGERVVIRGPSGCGKTTFLRALAGLHAAKGKIEVAGREVSALAPHERGLGFVFQDSALFPFLNVMENVEFGLRYQQEGRHLSDDIRRGKARALLERFGLIELANRSVSGLSGGEAQRIALLRSLILEPKVLLLDEPLSKLDSENRQRLSEWIDELAAVSKIATLVVSHQDDELTRGAQRVCAWKGDRECSIEF